MRFRLRKFLFRMEHNHSFSEWAKRKLRTRVQITIECNFELPIDFDWNDSIHSWWITAKPYSFTLHHRWSLSMNWCTLYIVHFEGFIQDDYPKVNRENATWLTIHPLSIVLSTPEFQTHILPLTIIKANIVQSKRNQRSQQKWPPKQIQDTVNPA